MIDPTTFGAAALERLPWRLKHRRHHVLDVKGHPMVSEYRCSAAWRPHLIGWVDGDEHVNRWLCWRVRRRSVQAWQRKRESLSSVLMENPEQHVVIFDLEPGSIFGGLWLCGVADLPLEYRFGRFG